MSIEYRDSKGVLHKIASTPDEEKDLQAGTITIADLLVTRGTVPISVDPTGSGQSAASNPRGGPAPDSVRRWLKYYPGLQGSNGEPNQWAYLLQNTVQEGLRSGKLGLDVFRNLETGKISQQALQGLLQRAQEGHADPWRVPGPSKIGSEDVLAAVGQTNPLSLALYGANAAMGTSFGESLGVTMPQGMNPFGPLAPGQEQRVAPLRPAAGLASTLPLGILGRLAGGVVGGAVDAGAEATRQQATTGSVSSPGAVLAQGGLGFAANVAPGLGWLGEGRRLARAAKTGATLAGYGGASQAISNYADRSASPTTSPGQLEPGNVDLYKQPSVANADGTHSTVDSFSVNVDGREVLLPSVTPDGRHLSQADAITEYRKTGRTLGVFDSPASATQYAKQLHNDYAAGKYAAGNAEPATNPLKTALYTGLFGAALGAAHGGDVRQGGTLRDKGMVGQYMDAALPKPAARTSAGMPPPGPTAPGPAGPGTPTDLASINAKLRDLARNAQYDTPEYAQLLSAQRTAQAAMDQGPAAPARDIQQLHDQAVQELAALQGAGVTSPRIAQLKRRVASLSKKLAAGVSSAPPSETAPLSAPAPAAAAAPATGKTAPTGPTVPAFDPNIEVELHKLQAAGRLVKPEGGMTEEADALIQRALGAAPAEGPKLPAAPPKTPKVPPAPLKAGEQRQRFAVPFKNAEEMRTKAPQVYRTHLDYMDRLVKQMGYPAAKQWIEAAAQGRAPQLKVGADKAGRALLATTQTLSKTPNHLRVVWDQLAPHYAQQAERAGLVEPGKQVKTIGKQLARGVTPDTTQALKAAAESLGNAEVASNAPFIQTPKQAAEQVAQLKSTSKMSQQLAGWVPPQHKDSPLSVWPIAEVENAARAMFSTKKKTIGEPTKHQVLVAGSRLMERYEKQVALGKDPVESASAIMDLGKSGRLKEHRFHAQGMAKEKLQDWMGTGGGQGSLGPRLDAPVSGTFGMASSLSQPASPESAFTQAEQGLVDRKVARRQNVKGVEKGAAVGDVAGLAPKAEESSAAQPGPKLGDKLLAAAPFALYPSDDEDDDTNKYAKRLAMLGLGTVAGASLWLRSRKTWRLGGKPVPKLSAPIRPGQAAALVHDDIPRVISIAKGIKEHFPAFADKVEVHAIEDAGAKGAALYLPKELEQDQAFTRRFSRTLQTMESSDVKEAAAKAPKQVPAAPKASTEDAFSMAGTQTAMEPPPPDTEHGGLAGNDSDAFSGAVGQVAAEGPGGTSQAPGWKPRAPIFAENDTDVDVLDSQTPSAKQRLADGRFSYDPRDDRRIYLRDSRSLTPYEQQLNREGAQKGQVPVPNPGGVRWYSQYDPNNANDPLTMKLAAVRKDKPFAQATVIQDDKTGKYAISVNEHGYMGPVVRMRRKDDQAIVTGYKPNAWAGYTNEYRDAVKAGQVKAPKQVTRVKGHQTLPYEIWSPSEGRTIEIPVEGEQGQGYKRQAQGDVEGLRKVERVPTVGIAPITGAGVKTQKIEVSNRPVALFKGKNTAQLDKIANAIQRQFGKDTTLLTQELPNGERVLLMDRQHYDRLNRVEREIASELPEAADPDTYVYRPTEFSGRPVGLTGKSTTRIEAAPDVIPEMGTGDLSASRIKAYEQASRAKNTLQIQRAAEKDVNKRAQLDKQIRRQTSIQYAIMGDRKNPAVSGKLTWKEAKDAGFKTLEISANEMRVAEVRKALRDEFGDDYVNHFVARGQKTPGGFRWHIAVSPEFMEGASRLTAQRSAVSRERVRLRTGAAPPAPQPRDIIKNDRINVPIEVKQVVEFSSRSGVERGIVDKVSPDGNKLWVRMKDGRGLVPLDKDYVRVVESAGKTINKPLPQLAAFQDNTLVQPLVEHMTGKTAGTLTDRDYDQAWQLLKGEADKTGRTTFETIKQAYKDTSVEPPPALKAAMQRLQPRGLTGASREAQDMAANVAVAPHEIVQDVLWNINGSKPTAGQVIKFTKELDQKVDQLVKAGLVDTDDLPKARLVLLQRLASQAGASQNTDRAEQLATTVAALSEAVRGLPRDPFGDWQLPKLPRPKTSGSATGPGSSSPHLPTSVEEIIQGLLAPHDQTPSGHLGRIVDDLIEAKRAGRQFAERKYGTMDAQLGADPDKWAAVARERDLFGKHAATQKGTYKPPKVGDVLPPKPDVDVVRHSLETPATSAVMRSADAVVFFDTPIAGKPTRGSKFGLFPLPHGPMGKFGLGESSTLAADKIPGKIPTVLKGQGRPSSFATEWEMAGKLSGKKLVKRVLNPTVSELQKLLTTFSPVTGKEARRQPRIVVVGDDAGKVAFAQQAARPGSGPLFEAAIADAKRSVGVAPDAKLTPDQWKKALSDPKNWRLLSLLPAAAVAGTADAEASTGDDLPGSGFVKYLPALVTLGLVAGGAAAYRAYRNRPVVPRVPTGATAIEALAARQKTRMAEQMAPTPIEYTGTAFRKALQNKYVELEHEQGKHADLLPHERAMDVWAQRLGGGGGPVDAAILRVEKTLNAARKEGVADALVDELNIRGAERVRDTLTRRVVDTENRVATLKQTVKDLNVKLGAATSATDKLQLGKQRSLALRALGRARRRLGGVGKAMGELHAGTRLPGGLTPTTLASEKAVLAARPDRNQGRVAELAERIYQEPRQVMDQMLASGVIPKALYDDVVSKDKGYVNLRRYFEHVQTTRVGKLKQAFGPNAALDVTSDRILKHLEGSDVDPLHPIQALTLFLRDAHRELAQQDATRSMVDLLRKDPTNMVKRVKVDVDGQPIGKDLQYVRDNNLRPVTHLVDGLPVHYAVPDWAAQLADVAGQAPTEADAFWKLLGRARGWSQASMTSLQAPFQVVNMLRDVSTAGKLVPQAFNRLDPVDVVKRYKDWGTSLFEVLKGSGDYQKLLEEGAAYSTFTKGLDPTLYQDLIDNKLLGNDRRVLRTIKQVTSAIEEATKLMTWKRLRDRGVPTLDRVTMTRQFGGSPDFWTSGDWARGMGTMLLFFNPAVQGITQSVKGIARHPGFLLAGALGGAALNHAWNSQFSNDQGELDLYDVDPNVRSNNFVFLKPWKVTDENGRQQRPYWAVPKPHISQLLYQPIEAAFEARERGTVDVGASLNALLSKLLPVTSESFEMERPSSIVEGLFGSVIPPLRLPAELFADRRLYGNRPIEGKAFEHTRQSERYRPSTSMLFRDIGKGVGKVQSLGGQQGEGWSPLKLEYGARSMFPGPVDVLTDTYDTVGGMLGREVPNKPGGRIPIISSVRRRFGGPQYEGARITAQRNDFYSLLDRARKDQRIGPSEGIAPYAQFLEKQATTLSEWRKQRLQIVDQIRVQGPSAERSAALDQLLKAEQNVLASSQRVVREAKR